MNEPVRARGERRARRALAVVAATLLAGAAPLHAASAKSKVKSRAKIITLSPASSYVLSVEGNFSLTSGEAVESGTVTAPKVQISKVNAGGTSAWFGNGSGRGSLRLDFGNCSLEGPMTFTFLVANPIARVPVTAPGPAASGDDELMSLNTKPTVPPGSDDAAARGWEDQPDAGSGQRRDQRYPSQGHRLLGDFGRRAALLALEPVGHRRVDGHADRSGRDRGLGIE